MKISGQDLDKLSDWLESKHGIVGAVSVMGDRIVKRIHSYSANLSESMTNVPRFVIISLGEKWGFKFDDLHEMPEGSASRDSFMIIALLACNDVFNELWIEMLEDQVKK